MKIDTAIALSIGLLSSTRAAVTASELLPSFATITDPSTYKVSSYVPHGGSYGCQACQLLHWGSQHPAWVALVEEALAQGDTGGLDSAAYALCVAASPFLGHSPTVCDLVQTFYTDKLMGALGSEAFWSYENICIFQLHQCE